MVETWPELGKSGLDVEVLRAGQCDSGYEFRIASREHGNMKKFAVTGTTINVRVVNPSIKMNYQAGVNKIRVDFPNLILTSKI